MSAVPLAGGSRELLPDPVESRFWREVAGHRSSYAELWQRTSDETPDLGCRVSRRRQLANARATRRLIDELATRIESYPDSEPERLAWRERLQVRLRRFGEERFGWPDGYRNLLSADAFFEASVSFVRQARELDPQIRAEEIGQALRNVWIINSLQMLLEQEVGFSPAIFAYSLLYPYTDNYLDDPQIAAEAKRELNRRLGRKLAGDSPSPQDRRQADIFRLVEMIEKQFPRGQYPQVSLSLQAIHQGQLDSLAQQDPGQKLSQLRLLELSVGKGGASVLADGYLTAGALQEGEADFCFGYGVLLQLLDDLQDVQSDRAAQCRTLFSVAADRGRLDRLTSRLYRFMHQVVDCSRRFASPRHADLKDLILRNCTSLLVSAVAENRQLFSRPFRRHLEARWPLSFGSMRRLRRRASQRFEEASHALCRRRGVSSPYELL